MQTIKHLLLCYVAVDIDYCPVPMEELDRGVPLSDFEDWPVDKLVKNKLNQHNGGVPNNCYMPPNFKELIKLL